MQLNTLDASNFATNGQEIVFETITNTETTTEENGVQNASSAEVEFMKYKMPQDGTFSALWTQLYGKLYFIRRLKGIIYLEDFKEICSDF
ncbi:hypothetical protein NPIL_476451 [Nephila pilipes]|uniref:Uncharacterized protein n=1 Tax=Nephila pilipes TaxID=299642 RepID=A0A8X6THZ0_NEPPI|nr:hypothetical protein NPIL_476451 [Nephila pilipes]